MRSRGWKVVLSVVFVLTLFTGIAVVIHGGGVIGKVRIVGYFDNSNGLFTGDEVRILGVAVGGIDTIEPEVGRVKITFWVDDKYKVPADATAAIVSPQLVTSRAIQLTPAYTGGPVMADNAVIPLNRTAVPLEWDDLRQQLEKLTETLQPTEPGGVSTLGAFINTSADNLRGQGENIRDTVLKLSQAFSILGDHSNDVFGTIKNLSVVVSALHDSSMLLGQLNNNLAAVTGLLADSPGVLGTAIEDLYGVVDEATQFIADNRESVGTATDKLASITTTVHESLGDVEQALHLFPTTLQNFINIYQPAQQGITGALTLQNFANPISFLCGGIQAASRLNSEQSAKLCVQYLAPIIKNRQFNFPPLGANYVVGAALRPNEITYSEDWLRPDHVPVALPPPVESHSAGSPLAAEAIPAPEDTVAATDPAAGLPGMMIPSGGGA